VKELYTTVEREAKDQFEEKRSLFIGYAKPVKTEEEAQAFIKQKKKEHADATHNVFAYLLSGGIIARYSDDGEPQGTAGMPVLDTLRKSGVDDVCVVVTRYFGGTLLGAGGLVRAYGHAARLALDAAHIVTYECYDELSLRCSYAEYQKLMPLLSAAHALIDDTVFEADVTVRIALKSRDAKALTDTVAETFGGRLTCQKEGQRYDYR